MRNGAKVAELGGIQVTVHGRKGARASDQANGVDVSWIEVGKMTDNFNASKYVYRLVEPGE